MLPFMTPGWDPGTALYDTSIALNISFANSNVFWCKASLSNIVVAPFGLFRKKERGEELPAVADQLPKADMPPGEEITIQQAQEILRQIESSKLQGLSSRLAPIKAAAEQSLRAIGDLASEMEREKIKLEGLEQKFKSLVENSRKTIVSTLRREATASLELPQSVNDAKKFREKFESLMNRFGEVTGSHSKILNNFMKKQSSKIKEEFEVLRELLTQAKAAITGFEHDREPIIRCSGVLNTAMQKVTSLQSSVAAAETTKKEISSLQEEVSKMQAQLQSLESSPEFQAAQSVAQKVEIAESTREEFRSKWLDQFSHISRAFTKYSYGVSKETEARLNLMSTEPWKILEMPDVSSYTSLLLEVRKSVSSGKIQLKDSDKTTNYIDLIMQSLPEAQARARQIETELGSLRSQDFSAFNRAQTLRQLINEASDRLSRDRDSVEFLIRQNQEKKSEVESLLREASDQLESISGRKYSIRF
jgi:chromosome segregation ATPase